MPLLHSRAESKDFGSLRILIVMLLFPDAVLSQTPPDTGTALAFEKTIATEVLTPPVVKLGDLAGRYPTNEVHQNREGWVNLGFMVDPKGKPFEITVTDSSGDKALERAAEQMIEDAKVDPGMLNGQPVESATQMKVVFALNGVPVQASREFIASYSDLMKAIKVNDRAAADAALKSMTVTNLYEDAYLGIANSQYARVWGDASQQLKGLQRAIASEHEARYLPKEVFDAALLRTLKLQLDAHRYREALNTWNDLKKAQIDSVIQDRFKPVLEQVAKLRSDDTEYDIPDSMPDGGWHLLLFKSHFRVKVSEGQVSDVKLRCAKGFVRFAFDPTLEYKVESKYGDCSLELEGDRGTRFTLTQF